MAKRRTPPPAKKKPDKYVVTTFIPEVKATEATNAFKIFHTTYTCQVANIHTESLESMRKRQPRGDESGAAGVRYAQELRIVDLTIDGMVEVMMEGGTVHLLDETKAREIYETIRGHLEDWANVYAVAINRPDLPEDDLRSLDMFASIIYPTARHYIETERTEHVLARLRALRGPRYFDLAGLREGIQRRTAPEEPAPYVAPIAHTSMMDNLANPPEFISPVKSKWT